MYLCVFYTHNALLFMHMTHVYIITTLVRDTFSMLGSSKCEINLKGALYSVRLTEESKKYCGILPYFGSAFYLYHRMPMVLNISPAA